MNNSDQPLDLKLPPREAPKPPKRTGETILLLVIVGLLSALLWQSFQSKSVQQKAETSSEVLKKLALKLEQQGLHESAVSVWHEYLETEGDLSLANVWYRIATVYQKLDSHEEALAALYRAEALAEGDDLKDDINVMVQSSLEALGKFATLQTELKERVGLNEATDDTVIAEIGNRKIRESELAQEIENLVERQMAAFKGRMSTEQIEEQRKNMLKQFNSDQQKMQLLGTYVAQELLYQKAIKDKLHQSAQARKQIKQIEKDFLVNLIMESQKQSASKISEQDIKASYEERKEEFTTPHTITLQSIKRDSKGEAQKVLDQLRADPNTSEIEGVTDLSLKVGYRLPNIDISAQQLSLLKNVKAGEVCNSVFETDNGSYVFVIKTQEPGSQQTFEEVRGQIGQLLQMQQDQKVQAEFLQRLKEEYDVVIHQDAFKPKED